MAPKNDTTVLKTIVDVVSFLLVTIFYIVQAIVNKLLPQQYQRHKSVRGEVVLVTGGGGGLGRLLALRLAKLGAKVVLWDVNSKGVEETIELIKGIGGTANGYVCDLANKDDVYKIADQTRKEIGDVSILINNAGVLSGGLLLNTPDDLIKRTFDVNIIAHFWTVKAFLPKMIENNHGHIVTIASMAGHCGVSKLVDYCASKYAAVGFDEALRVELEDQGIDGVKTTVICPYFIQSTGMFDNVRSRFVPTLKSNDVADRIIEGLTREEVIVLIPGVSSIGLALKALMPWSVISMFLKGLLPDAVPHHNAKLQNIVDKNNATSGKCDLRTTVTSLNHNNLDSDSGKNL